MQKIVLIGAGNLAGHLVKAFRNSPVAEIVQIYNRSLQHAEKISDGIAAVSDPRDLAEADVYIVCISDDAVEPFISQHLQKSDALVVHTSGSLPMLDICQRNGVFYPLQTFSKNTAVDFSSIPICIEAEKAADLQILQLLAGSISPKVYPISSAQRKTLHLAAVFACNFSNHLYSIAEDICTKAQIPFEILYPLIRETAHKIEYHSPKKVQTGPAKRGDKKTIAAHLNQLDSPKLKEIYTLLTQLIQEKNGSEL